MKVFMSNMLYAGLADSVLESAILQDQQLSEMIDVDGDLFLETVEADARYAQLAHQYSSE